MVVEAVRGFRPTTGENVDAIPFERVSRGRRRVAIPALADVDVISDEPRPLDGIGHVRNAALHVVFEIMGRRAQNERDTYGYLDGKYPACATSGSGFKYPMYRRPIRSNGFARASFGWIF